ncbi:MAG TPA: SUMF1/EgtB/PvdO family nonheme iron enzyme [Bryobacteraceae bacterium]|nr:SUMF1/EgtB/PvdO family nonheme iron enzyme [Bryobacteraceae bacterium]
MRTQTELASALSAAREQTDELFRLIRPNSLYERPIPERHRIVFYLGHLEAFDWNLIGRYALDIRSFQPEFDRLFAFGIDPPPGQLPCDQPSDWPSLAEVERYNLRTRDEIDDLISEVPEQLCHVAIEHRLMHAETFAYIMHNLSYAQKFGQPSAHAEAAGRPLSRWIDVPGGSAKLGREANDGFGWDNEFYAHTVDVPPFSIAKYKVTNGDYLEFVKSGAEPPFFWVERDGRWFYRGMFAETPLPLDCPVYVTWQQADGYAKWRGAKLPTEAQFHRAAGDPPASGNFGFRHWDPIPVTAQENPANADCPQQMYGNGWEWTSTVFAPFPGFEPFPFYTNYSAPFFDGDHYVLKGASPQTASCFLRPSFRNWFRPEYPYLYSTFRLVES